MPPQRDRSWLAYLLLAGLVASSASVAESNGEQQERTTPQDTAVLDLDLPAGTTLQINGKDWGTQRHFVNHAFQPGQCAVYDLRVRFPDGEEASRQIVLQGGRRVSLPLRPPGGSGAELVLQTGHANPIAAAVFSPDGKYVLTQDGDLADTVLWDVQTGRKLRSFRGPEQACLAGYTQSVGFSLDGKRAVTGQTIRGAVLWDVTTGQKLRTFPEGGESSVSVSCVTFRPGSQQLLTEGLGEAILWDVNTAERRGSFRQEEGIRSAAFSADGKRLLLGGKEQAHLWDVDTGRELGKFEAGRDGVGSAALSPDGRQVLTISSDEKAILWDAETQQEIRTLNGPEHEVLQTVLFSADGRQALIGSGAGTAIFWDPLSGQRLRTLTGLGSRPLAWSPDGKRILTVSRQRSAVLWDAITGQRLHTLQGHDWWSPSTALSSDGRLLLTQGSRDTAVLWDLTAGTILRRFREKGQDIDTLALDVQGRRALNVNGKLNGKGKAVLWDMMTGEQFRTFEGSGESEVSAAALSPDGQQVLLVSWDGTANLRAATTGEQLHVLTEAGSEIRAGTFSPDGQEMLTGAQDGTVTLWDAGSGRKVRSLGEHGQAVCSVAFSPDGHQVLTGSADRTARLWETSTGRKLRTFPALPEMLLSVGFTGDGNQVLLEAASGKSGPQLMLCDVATGRKLRTVEFQGELPFPEVGGWALHPEGRFLFVGRWDGTIRLLDLATGDEVARLLALDEGRDYLVVTPEGLFDGSAGGQQKVAWRLGKGLNVVPVDRFFQDFYRPGLLAALLRGERPLPEVDLGEQQAPLVTITTPRQGGVVESEQVTLEVKVTDQGGGIRGPTLLHNGARVLAPGRAEQKGKTLTRRFLVNLVEGENRLEVRAASSDGSMDSEPATLLLNYQKPLARPELYVLAVGINRYAQESLNLKYAADDARALADLFRRRGPSLYRDVHVRLLLDQEATRDGIRQALTVLAGEARPQDTLVVFLAGHGTMVGQLYYFVPHEFQRQADSIGEDVRQQGLAANVLGESLAAVPALKRVLILDTCQSGGLVGLSKAGRDPFAFRGAIERLGRAQGVFTIAAAAAGDEAHEVAELQHGVLTYALLAGLQATAGGPLEGQAVPAENSERVADVLAWFQFASGQVPRLTKRYFGRAQDVQTSTQGVSFPVLPVEDR